MMPQFGYLFTDSSSDVFRYASEFHSAHGDLNRFHSHR